MVKRALIVALLVCLLWPQTPERAQAQSTGDCPIWNGSAWSYSGTAIAAARLPAFGSGDVSFASGGGAGTIANVPNTATFAANSLTSTPNNKGEWTVFQVSGSDATTTGQTLTNVTGLVTGTLSLSSSYEFEATLSCTTSAVTTGTEYGVNVTVAPTTILAQYSGAVTSTTGGITTTNANNSAEATAFLTTSGQAGIIIIKGFFVTAGSGSPAFSIQHLKVTSGTSTVKIGSILRVRKL